MVPWRAGQELEILWKITIKLAEFRIFLKSGTIKKDSHRILSLLFIKPQAIIKKSTKASRQGTVQKAKVKFPFSACRFLLVFPGQAH